MRIPKRISQIIKTEKFFVIAVHVNPDGDALGSALALSIALESAGKKTVVYSRDPIPGFYRFLPGYERVTSRLGNITRNKPLLFLLDCNDPERAALEDYTFGRSIVIDHHETEKNFGDIKWINPKAAATGLMIYYLIGSLGISFNRDIATNLYAAISVDTGTFRYSNTSSELFKVGAALVKLGADPGQIADNLYETWAQNRFKLLALALQTLEINKNIATTYVTQNMLKKTRTKPEDTEHFSNFPRMIKTVKISLFFRERSRGTWKVSLRSKGDVDVASIAERFGGGGHKNAAGCLMRGTFSSVKNKAIRAAVMIT
jgi:phosphoesterase RecJ-like protein